jgi:hypothetical protein
MSQEILSTSQFDGYCFTAVKVRFAGSTNTRGSRWVASLYRGNDDITRTTLPYDHARAGGAANARPAAEACFVKARQTIDEPTNLDDWYVVPAELNADSYVFTFVPRYMVKS